MCTDFSTPETLAEGITRFYFAKERLQRKDPKVYLILEDVLYSIGNAFLATKKELERKENKEINEREEILAEIEKLAKKL